MPLPTFDDSRILWTPAENHEHYAGTPYSTQARRRYILPNGKEKVAYTSHHKGFVIGMALTPKNEIVVVREYRPGPEQVMMDMPCGGLNDGEDPSTAMLRELEEETGYQGVPEFANVSFTGPFSNQQRFTFIVRDCQPTGKQKFDHDEFIKVVKLPLEDFVMDWAVKGKTTNGAAVFYCLAKLGKIIFNFPGNQ